jgi:hypothetical protein
MTCFVKNDIVLVIKWIKKEEEGGKGGGNNIVLCYCAPSSFSTLVL